MKYAEVARQVGFAYELGGNKDLATLIQRGISARTEAITQYLLQSEHRFLGALIVAAWGGDPHYTEVVMQDPDGMLEGLDRGFGVLTFDGTQQYFALDGQHRLRAIKDALKQQPELGREDICVLLVSHYDTDEGREKTRRLFTNINRNAKATTKTENIALDVDDGFAILARRFVTEHPFLAKRGIVRIFTRVADEGDIRLAAGSVNKTDRDALTTLVVLYEMLALLGPLDRVIFAEGMRPADEFLESSYVALQKRIDQLMDTCGSVRSQMIAAGSAREVRAPKGAEAEGHPFMRPVVQKAVCRVVAQILEQKKEGVDWNEIMARLGQLDWRMGAAPWLSVFSVEKGKMISGKEFSNLLDDLLRVHLAPSSKAEIKRALKSFRDLRGMSYPVSQDELESRVTE